MNKAELTVVILLVRKALGMLAQHQKVVVHSDSKYCTDGKNKSMQKWFMDGWTRRGKHLRNADLWKVMQRPLNAMKEARLNVEFRHVPAHVGIFGNVKVDKLAKAALQWAHKNAPRTHEDLVDLELYWIANEIVAACCNVYH